jgi:hypothetical protein
MSRLGRRSKRVEQTLVYLDVGTKNKYSLFDCSSLAERVGFEPTVESDSTAV